VQVDLAFAMLLTTLAGLSTGIGSAIAFVIRKPSYAFLAVALGFSAGVMLYISFAELLKTAIDDVGFGTANLAFFSGISGIAAIDWLIPHQYEEEPVHTTQLFGSRSRAGFALDGTAGSLAQSGMLKRASLFLALGIAIHNFPEGLVTFSSAATGDASLGIAVAIAIALHNVPEGIAVSVPIYYATGSRWKAFAYSFSSGLAEPVGALLGYAILLRFLTPTVLSSLLAFVAGIMVYITLDELLPLAHKYGKENPIILACGLGMLIMAASLFILGR
jgi:zinc transporter, ZIP family